MARTIDAANPEKKELYRYLKTCPDNPLKKKASTGNLQEISDGYLAMVRMRII